MPAPARVPGQNRTALYGFDQLRPLGDVWSGRVLWRELTLDAEFFEGRYADATRADRLTLRVAGSLGGERFEIAKLAAQFTSRNANATQQSINRLLKSSHIYRVSQGVYAYTAPLFGDFVRRKYPRQDEDR